MTWENTNNLKEKICKYLQHDIYNIYSDTNFGEKI